MLPNCFVKAAKANLADIKFDLIITHTPFVSSYKIMKPLLNLFKCPAHLLLWDIFPQNARDLGIIKSNILYKILKKSEHKMLRLYDKIWCMSNGNVTYVKEHYPFVKSVDLLYNSAKVTAIPSFDRLDVRKRYNIAADEVVAIFGGNLGVPQCLKNILKLASIALQNGLKAKFIFVGSGTEANFIKNQIIQLELKNTIFIEQIPRVDYELLTRVSDIGLVSLDERFTVPNFPSKTTDYFKAGLPVLASLDKCAANDYGNFLEKITNAGIYALAGNNTELYEKFLILYNDSDLRIRLGTNGRKFFEIELNVKNAYDKIISSLCKIKYD